MSRLKIPIGFRTLKTALGVAISVGIAQSLGLANFTAAGILTLLCIQKSRKQSISAAVSRAIACVASIIMSTLLFEAIGYKPYAFLILLLVFIPFAVWINVKEGIASSIVIVMHVYIHSHLEWAFLLNEVYIIMIGLGVALLINWYMPSQDREISLLRQRIDGLFVTILHEMAVYLKNHEHMWSGHELLTLSDELKKARYLATLEAENNRRARRKDGIDYLSYFDHKQRQFELLQKMLPFISRIHSHGELEQSVRIGDFVERLSENLYQQSEAEELAQQLSRIRHFHKKTPLPDTREQFEDRANLFALTNELEWFVDTVRSRWHLI